ncbi:MAG: lysophospholipid acyltransferase family protein [Nocardioidaceae bacterium]
MTGRRGREAVQTEMKVGSRGQRAAAFGFCFEQLLKGGLRGVWVRGAAPSGGAVWAANHHSWWDGFVANAVLLHAGHHPSLVMDADNLRQFSFLRDLGALPADQPRAALRALHEGRTVIVFPESELRPSGPLGPLAPGASWLARRSGVPLAIAATRVVLRGQQKPEAYVDISVSAHGEVSEPLAGSLQRLDAELAERDPREPLPGFSLVVPGRSSWDERITTVSGWLRR